MLPNDCWKWLWVSIPLQSLQMLHLFRARSSLTFRQPIECRFTLKSIPDMIRTYSQMHSTDKYSQHSSSHLVSLAKWLSVRLRTKWLWVGIPLESLKLYISCLIRATISLRFRQLYSVEALWNASMAWREHAIKCMVQISTNNTTQSFGQFGKIIKCSFITKWLGIQIPFQSLKLQILRLFWARSSLKYTQLLSLDSLWNAYVTW